MITMMIEIKLLIINDIFELKKVEVFVALGMKIKYYRMKIK